VSSNGKYTQYSMVPGFKGHLFLESQAHEHEEDESHVSQEKVRFNLVMTHDPQQAYLNLQVLSVQNF